MKKNLGTYIPALLALILGLLCTALLLMYISPMEDISLDLSLGFKGEALVVAPDEYDDKGWTVFTQDGDTRTELAPDGIGGYTGLELGQTFYFSRVMEEVLDSPTLQLGVVEQTFAVWLDDTLIYADCPELDNRIGHLQLPMSDWLRSEPIIISLPQDYQGKTLTIAQSFPPYSETGSVKAFPASVHLYCGYAYESGLISETFRTAIAAAAAFVIIIILLIGFISFRDWALLCLAAVPFMWMTNCLVGTSFFWKYFGSYSNTPASLIPLLSTLALLVYLILRSGNHTRILWGATAAFALCVFFIGIEISFYPYITPNPLYGICQILSYWIGFAVLLAILILGGVRWRKDNRFYRVFTPLALAALLIYWGYVFIHEGGTIWYQLSLTLDSGRIDYIFHRVMPPLAAAALLAAIVEVLKKELDRRTEKRLLAQQMEMAQASYEHLRRQHEEVLMLRHDMMRHFHTLRVLSHDDKISSYLDCLIGQNSRVRPVVESGNHMLDVILNGRLSAAIDAGIQVEVQRVQAPARLPLSDPDLCALIMNIVDNAITAASAAEDPRILLDIHDRDGFLAIVCENSFLPQEPAPQTTKETVQQHGLGLKIMRSITERCEGVMMTENEPDLFRVKIILPLT